MFIDMLNHPNFKDYDMSTRQKTGNIGASPVPIETMKQIISKMNMKDIVCVIFIIMKNIQESCRTVKNARIFLKRMNLKRR